MEKQISEIKLTKDMLRVGKQVAYVPRHVIDKWGNAYNAISIDANGVEYGFVSSWSGDTVFCRFWSPYSSNELRTTANSEGCNINDLYFYPSRMQSAVDKKIDALRAGADLYGWHEQGEEE
jgi:hypothetical protein